METIERDNWDQTWREYDKRDRTKQKQGRRNRPAYTFCWRELLKKTATNRWRERENKRLTSHLTSDR